MMENDGKWWKMMENDGTCEMMLIEKTGNML